jgi:hypothetical protein
MAVLEFAVAEAQGLRAGLAEGEGRGWAGDGPGRPGPSPSAALCKP